jgi:hypothetical protein
MKTRMAHVAHKLCPTVRLASIITQDRDGQLAMLVAQVCSWLLNELHHSLSVMPRRMRRSTDKCLRSTPHAQEHAAGCVAAYEMPLAWQTKAHLSQLRRSRCSMASTGTAASCAKPAADAWRQRQWQQQQQQQQQQNDRHLQWCASSKAHSHGTAVVRPHI